MLLWLTSVPWMATTITAPTETPVAASVAYVDFTPAFDPPALRIGDECFVPAKLAGRLGWKAQVSDDKAVVTVDGKDYSTFARYLGKEAYLPARTIASLAGGISEWGKTNDLRVHSRVIDISVEEGNVTVTASLGVRPRLTIVDRPPRAVVDIPGARVEQPTLNGAARFSQFQDNTVRVVVQLDKVPTESSLADGRATLFTANWAGARPTEMAGLVPTTTPPSTEAKLAIPPRTPLLFVGLPLLEKDGAKESILRLPIRGTSPKSVAAIRDKQGIYWVHLPTAARDASLEFKEISSEVIKSANIVDRPAGGVSLRMELKRPMGVRVGQAQSSLAIRITEPKSAGGTLADKMIVVDAGHGGGDPGARYGDVAEKNITLPIAKYVAEGLADAGCTVVLTREDDATTNLYSRPQIANDSKAHFFVSVHINSNGVSNSASGTYTYYHNDDPDSKLLAECIQAEVAKVTGLPDHGAVTDRGPAPTKGFAVLRGSTMPAVLVEVAYINNSVDRKLLLQDEFRKKVAAAIVRGIRVYIGEQGN